MGLIRKSEVVITRIIIKRLIILDRRSVKIIIIKWKNVIGIRKIGNSKVGLVGRIITFKKIIRNGRISQLKRKLSLIRNIKISEYWELIKKIISGFAASTWNLAIKL